MNSLIKKVGFLIDRGYARQVKAGKPFNPLLPPSLFGLYILSVVSRLFTSSNAATQSGLSWRSRLMHLLGHSFFPGRHGTCELSDDEIFQKHIRFSTTSAPKVTFLVQCGDSLRGLVRLLESIESNSLE